jgi:protein-tyrosine phosphatase
MLVGELTDEIASGRKVGIHCRMGIGRSGLVAACVMAWLGVPRDQLFPMLSKARRLEVPDTPEQVRWVLQYLEIR